MTAANFDATNAKDAPVGGIIPESVMSKIWNISHIPLPLTDMISKGTHKNAQTGWIEDELPAAGTDNAHVDGVDVDQNDTVVPPGWRTGHRQHSKKCGSVHACRIATHSVTRAR